jgi:hypothetical protein
MMKQHFWILCAWLAVGSCMERESIDREALVTRNNPHVTEIHPLHSLNLGNGEFAVTLDATGLQTFSEFYKSGLSLGTYSEWGWHSFPNVEGYSEREILEDHPLPGHPQGLYAVQKGRSQSERSQQAAEWFRANPHRLHLGNIGFEGMETHEISGIDQTLDLWNGMLVSRFDWKGMPVSVKTVCSGDRDLVAAQVESELTIPVLIRFPYPSGQHTDDASDWAADQRHSTEILEQTSCSAVLKRTLDETIYYVTVAWDGNVHLERSDTNAIRLLPASGNWTFSVGFSAEVPKGPFLGFRETKASAKKCWNDFWNTTGIIDFSYCTDTRARLLERRVILSQYLIRAQEAQNYPPAETGLTYNSWYGKYHLEMVMWHSFHYATWNEPQLLEKQLAWYKKAEHVARAIAQRQGFPGVRWMKMTDPSAREAPSDVGSFLIWQQPHPIYMAELIYRARPDPEFLDEYYDLVQETAAFMAAFVTYDAVQDRYVLQGACAANESYDEDNTLNPAFELSYWHYGLGVAQSWRERKGEARIAEWDRIRDKLAPLSMSPDGIYLPAERGPGIPDFINRTVSPVASSAPAGGYINAQRPAPQAVPSPISDGRDPFYVRATSSENLLAYGMLPACRLFNAKNMDKTLDRAAENWNWKGGSWSWNYPSLAMNATRLLRSDVAIRAITMDNRDDLLLPSGNNYRSETLRMYLPGNGGLLLAVGMMCAGWDGCTTKNPGFPNDGAWDVRWEGLRPMP